MDDVKYASILLKCSLKENLRQLSRIVNTILLVTIANSVLQVIKVMLDEAHRMIVNQFQDQDHQHHVRIHRDRINAIRLILIVD